MKKLLILPAVGLIMATAASAQTNEVAYKEDVKNLNKEESSISKKEKREEKKEIRKLKENEVSYQSRQAFYSDFGNLSVSKWERTPYFDKATFTNNGQVMTAFYDVESKLVGTVEDKSYMDLPANARKQIAEKYKGYTPEAVIFFDDNEINETDMILYGNQFEDRDSYFVELQKDNKKIVLHVMMDGQMDYFTQLK